MIKSAVFVLSMILSSTAFAGELPVNTDAPAEFPTQISFPYAISPAIDAKDVAAISKAMNELIQKYENGQADTDPDQTALIISSASACNSPNKYIWSKDTCLAAVKAGKTYAEYSYLSDRWNGVLYVTYDASSGQVKEFTDGKFDGNF